eukprot:TRINITY_DN28323_c0_g2_i1.p1 TRINITY_DN28323_c0_g2~~TRINITY_DN28323_c0_g2_i1.p1  ORF type:complete len:378 (-),score=59.70 TRINITY_DN28323_c0_g2_i1:78-1211(-)
MYRYSRGQSGQARQPVWGSSGGHGARASSPEPGGLAGGGNSNAQGGGGGGGDRGERGGGEPPKERQDEVILELQNELMELRNVCAWKDQKIAELSRTDTPAARLKRDIRQLAAELHSTRKQLSESLAENQELQERLQRGEVAASSSSAAVPGASGASVDATAGDSPSNLLAAGGAGKAHLQRIAELTEENKALRETVVQLKAQGARSNGVGGSEVVDYGGLQHGRQTSGAATQRASDGQISGGLVGVSVAPGRASEPPPPPATTYAGAVAPRAPYLAGPTAGGQAAQAGVPIPLTPLDDNQRGAELPIGGTVPQIVYSSANPGAALTMGPVSLQGVGTVDGVSSVAKVLLQRIQSSVLSVHRRPNPNPITVPSWIPE